MGFVEKYAILCLIASAIAVDVNAQHEYDVVVVGAGLAGLITARDLEGEGKSVKVVEAMDRFGGRMAGVEVATNQYVDFGGQWLGETQEEYKRLLEELGLEWFVAPNQKYGEAVGKNTTLRYGEKLYTYTGAYITSSVDELAAQGLPKDQILEGRDVYGEFVSLAREVFPDEDIIFPTSEALRKYDIQTFGQWVMERTTGE